MKNKSKKVQGDGFIPAAEDWCGKELFENREVREGFLSDMLGIPRSAIKDTQVINSSLWKRTRKEKQGIVDIRIILNNDKVISIEIQVLRRDHWDKRQLFYLSKMYAENARRGEDYDELPDCISIAILDFNLTEDEEYFHCYKFRDENGKVFSEAMTVYILELKKKLGRDKVMDDWIRVFRAKREEELDMIKTKNRGILEAIRELKEIGPINIMRDEHEYNLKVKRDARARESYVRKEGIAIGKAEGKAEYILELLENLGTVPESLREVIVNEKDIETLDRWFKLATKAESIEEFAVSIKS